MEIALIIGRFALAAVFAVAGLTKLRDLPGSRAALLEFGAPKSLAGPVGMALPLVELAVALLLLPAATVAWSSVVALALLALFTAAIAVSLARGRRPACRCFGQLASGPVGADTLIRNGILITVATALVWHSWAASPPSLLAVFSALSALEAAVLTFGVMVVGALAGVSWLLLQVIRQQGRLLLRIDDLEQRLTVVDGQAEHHNPHPTETEGLDVGAPAPEFTLPSLTGRPLGLRDLLQPDRPLILIFTDPECGPCSALLPEIGGWQQSMADRFDIAVIGRGTVDANRARAAEHGVSPMLLQQNYEVADAYHVFATPGAVLVRPDGMIGGPVAGGPEPIRSLVTHTAANPHGPTWSPLLLLPMADSPSQPHDHGHGHPTDEPAALPVGSPAPHFELPDLDGRLVRSVDLHGRLTLLLFWNPGCAFCHQLLPAMLAWEASQQDGLVQLLVISEGPEEANRALGFRAAVLRDDTLAVGMQFGVAGTPSALLIGRDGAVASALAVGGAQILTLANAAQTAAPVAQG